MSLTINAKTYTANSFVGSTIGYYGPLHTVSVKDDYRLAMTAPKPTIVFSGVGRTSGKMTRTATLTGALTPTGEAIAEFTTSIPVGMASADIDTLLNDLGAFIASATYKTIVKNQQTSF
jgi:hypothetical protein